MHVVATAGHVDHGKSTLVEALTGMKPDRLEEERQRGLSIELGYCWTELEEAGRVAFVDVPGHERFITTTLAGLGPAPVAMFVVAADERWMPQAAEHLAALNALGVRHGVLVVTRADLADPEQALAVARAELGGSSLAGAPAVVVSGRTGEGLGRLRSVLTAVLREVPPTNPAADVRLWIDRHFHVRGTGTVVTGTLTAGTISIGDILALDERQVRIRALESLAVACQSVSGVARVAVAIGGRLDNIGRGSTLVTPGAFEPTTSIDVALAGEGRVPHRPVLHIGAAMLGVKVRPLGEGFARLILDRPLPVRIGDRAVLRDPGSRTIWGVRVCDPGPPTLSRRGAAKDRARLLADHDASLAAELRVRGLVRRSLLHRFGVARGPLPAGTIEVGDWLIDGHRAEVLRQELLNLVRQASTPLRRGVPSSTAARLLQLPDAALVIALAVPPLRFENGRILEETDELDPELQAAVARLRIQLADAPFAAPDAAQLAQLGLDHRVIATLHHSGYLLRVGDGIVLLPGADNLAVERLTALEQPFTSSAARQALGTSRRVALPLLQYLDRTGRTVRLPDDRRRLRQTWIPSE